MAYTDPADETQAFLDGVERVQRRLDALRGAIEQSEAAFSDIAEAAQTGDEDAWKLGHARGAATSRRLVESFEDLLSRMAEVGTIVLAARARGLHGE